MNHRFTQNSQNYVLDANTLVYSIIPSKTDALLSETFSLCATSYSSSSFGSFFEGATVEHVMHKARLQSRR